MKAKLNKLEIKNKKLWFSKYGNLLEIENRLKKKLLALEDQIDSVKELDSIDELKSAKAELENRITKAHKRNEQYKRDLVDTIQQLKDRRYRDVLTLHFIMLKSIPQVADELGYTTRTIFRLCSKALELVEISTNQCRRNKSS